LARLQDECPHLKGVGLLDPLDRPSLALGSALGSKFFLSYPEFLVSGSHETLDWEKIESLLSPSDILNLQFTSGSSGAPKATALTHRSMINSGIYIGKHLGVTESDRISIPLPLFHAFGLIIGLFTVFAAGASAVLPSEYFDAEATLKSVEKYACTGLYGVTTMFISEMAHPSFHRRNKSSLKFAIMAGSAMPEELVRRVTQSFPIPDVRTNWGMTELSSIATFTHITDLYKKRMQTAGRLLPQFEAKIVQPGTGLVLPWGERGEIVISGFGVMHSYYKDVKKTEETMKTHIEDLEPGQIGLDDTGKLRTWLHTGDEGYLDNEGYFVITGRIKDLIIRGGENISPLQIEERLSAHPAIEQASVFGLPDARLGEVPAAMLELKPGYRPRPSDHEIRAWVRETLAPFKAPTLIWWLGDADKGVPEEWPKTSNGKLRKKDIRSLALGQFSLVTIIALTISSSC
jgi:acyl-CoA synthetase (AMP-forming)/AMP-acid ligase II